MRKSLKNKYNTNVFLKGVADVFNDPETKREYRSI